MSKDSVIFLEGNDNVQVNLRENEVILSLGYNFIFHMDKEKADQIIDLLEGNLYDKTYVQLDDEVTGLRVKIRNLEEELEQYREALISERLQRII